MKRKRIQLGYELYWLLTVLSSICVLVCFIALLFARPISKFLRNVGWKIGHWTYAQVLIVGLALCLPYLIVNMKTYKRAMRPFVETYHNTSTGCIESSINRLISNDKRELKIGVALHLSLCAILWSIAGVLFWLYYKRNPNMVFKYVASPIICSAYMPLFCGVRNLLFSYARDDHMGLRQGVPKDENKNAVRFHYDVQSNSIWVGTEEDIQCEKRKRGQNLDTNSMPSDEELRQRIREMLKEIEEEEIEE